MGPRWEGLQGSPHTQHVPSHQATLLSQSSLHWPCPMSSHSPGVVLCTSGQGAVAAQHHLSQFPVTRTAATKRVGGAQLSC